jgi:hypothetical protein
MREAVKACYKSGVKIVATLHDALYAEIDRGDFDAVNKFREIMVSDFERVFKPWGVTAPITTEGFIWGEGASGFKGCLIGCEFEEVYIDAKGRSDFEKYRRFFE